MTRAAAWVTHLANALVAGTGLVYGWMRYFVEPDPEEALFAVANHPWQPAMQGLHIVLAPLLVFACGLIWSEHVWARIRSGRPRRRPTGLTLVALVFPMIASGYFLQVATGEGWRTAWIVVHVATSCGWIVVYVVHLLSRGDPQMQATGASRG